MKFLQCVLVFSTSSVLCRVIKDATVPLVCFRNKGKHKEKKEERLAALKNRNALLDPHETTIDSQIADTEALESSFPNANIKAVFFSICTGKFAKNSKFWIPERLPKKTALRIVFKSLLVLTQTPEEDTSLGFQKLKKSRAKKQKEKIAQFVNYFEATWLERKF